MVQAREPILVRAGSQRGRGGGSTYPKMVIPNNGFCGRQTRRRFCFRHTAGGKFFCSTVCVYTQNTQNIVENSKMAEKHKKDFDPNPNPKRIFTPLVHIRNDQRVMGIILKYVYWGTHRPPLGFPVTDRPTRDPQGLGQPRGGGSPPPPYNTQSCRTPLGVTHWLAAAPVHLQLMYPDVVCTATASSETAVPTAIWHEVVLFAIVPCF